MLIGKGNPEHVPGRTDMIVPSNSRAFSEFMIKCRPASRISKPAATIDFGSTDDCPRTSACLRHRMARDALFCEGRASLNTQRASVQFLAVERADGSFRFGFFIHGEERKAARLPVMRSIISATSPTWPCCSKDPEDRFQWSQKRDYLRTVSL